MKLAVWFSILLCSLSLPSLRAADASPSQPNILFLFADDQRADTIHALGNSIIQTPNLDRLVQRGVSFTRAYMQGGFTAATCMPSRAMLLSGRNLFHTDIHLKDTDTWPAAFGRAGYTTFVSGKWHNGDDSIARSFQIARSMFLGGMTNPLHAKLSHVIQGKVAPPQPSPKHACEVFADEAIQFLNETKTGPFFAYVPFDAPHDPHVTPEDFPVHYDPSQIPLPKNFLPHHAWDNGEMTVRDEKLLPWPRTPEAVRSMLADYYRYVSYLDAQIGRVLNALEASPHAKNTLVVFSADSGVARGSHGLIGKQNLYELDSIRVPLIIAGPGIPEAQQSQALCYLFDVLPTLGKRCGIAPPSGTSRSDGRDFNPTLENPSLPARPHLVFAYRDVQRAVCDSRWKLILYPQIQRTQLFDLEEDPYETRNLADQPAFARKVAELTALLASELRQSGDTQSLEVPSPRPAEWTPPANERPPRASK
ncbi:MAG: hypothetical protein RLZZ142_37 [Verrucomicrobiota bacterium]